MRLRRYTAKDKAFLVLLEEQIKAMHVPTSYAKKTGTFHAKKTGTTGQRRARQTVFGRVKWRGQERPSRASLKYPDFLPLCRRFMHSHRPEFRFTSVFLNINTVSKMHLDSGNGGDSVIVGLGPYTGGETLVQLKSGEVRKLDISAGSAKFEGSKLLHGSTPFRGTRYSLVFYK